MLSTGGTTERRKRTSDVEIKTQIKLQSAFAHRLVRFSRRWQPGFEGIRRSNPVGFDSPGRHPFHHEYCDNPTGKLQRKLAELECGNARHGRFAG